MLRRFAQRTQRRYAVLASRQPTIDRRYLLTMLRQEKNDSMIHETSFFTWRTPEFENELHQQFDEILGA